MPNKKHRLLERQMKVYGVDLEKNSELSSFIKAVNNSYNQFEKEQKILNNSSTKLINKVSLSNKNLKNTIETIDSFNYHVSHDLKSIITNTVGLSSMASKYFNREDREKLEKILVRLKSNGKAGLEVIEKYLEISKFETQVSQLKEDILDVEEQTIQVINKVDLSKKLKVIFVKKEFDTLTINEVSLHSILQNFITNAHKYSSPGRKPILEISLEKDEDYRIIKFKDNGLGIDLEKHGEKIFQPFVRLENKKIEGSGIGLFIVKKIINRMGGFLSLDSTLGEGSTFSVKLPQ